MNVNLSLTLGELKVLEQALEEKLRDSIPGFSEALAIAVILDKCAGARTERH